jgi:wyosine [tRNA(Phe)-imidazoG37] synthetase (radical SAM superfamily)
MRRRHSLTIATALTAAALTAVLATGCDPDDVDNSLDCVSHADTIADSVKAIHEAGWDAVKDPSKTDESIATIDKTLDEINKVRDESGDSEVDKAVKGLDKAIEDYNRSILDGDTAPDSARIDAAADRLKAACTS